MATIGKRLRKKECVGHLGATIARDSEKKSVLATSVPPLQETQKKECVGHLGATIARD